MHYSTNFIKKLETEISTQSDKRKPKPNVIVKPSLLCSGTVRCRGGEMNTHIIVTFYTFSYTNSYSYNAWSRRRTTYFTNVLFSGIIAPLGAAASTMSSSTIDHSVFFQHNVKIKNGIPSVRSSSMSVCVCVCVMGMLCGTLHTDEYIIPLTFAEKIETV